MVEQHNSPPFEITPQVLLKAYACGIFPMAESVDSPNLFWIEPERRGILPLDQLHIPKRLQRTVRSDVFQIRIDTDFEGVISGCAAPGNKRAETWINKEIRSLYSALFQMGNCHSVEAWRDGELVGGLYGVRLGGAFFGESMFSRVSDASKVALIHLAARLIAGGFTLLDTQFVTDHLAQFGTLDIPRAAYNHRLEKALLVEADFFKLPDDVNGAQALEQFKTSPRA